MKNKLTLSINHLFKTARRSLNVLLLLLCSSPIFASESHTLRFDEVMGVDVGRFIFDLVTEDINQDGQVDIIATSAMDVKFFFGEETGQFSTSPSMTVPYPKHIATGDFNGDGIIDLAIGQSTQYKWSTSSQQVCGRWAGVMIYIGVSEATPRYVFKNCLVNKMDSPPQPLVQDINHDGIVDIVVIRSDEVAYYLGKGNGEFLKRQQVALITNAGHGVVADINHDSHRDILLNDAFVLYGDGKGGFAKSDIKLGANTAIGDVNGDGMIDIVTWVLACCPLTNKLRVYSHYRNGKVHIVDKPVVTEINDLIVADFDGDKIDDVLARFEYDEEFVVFKGTKFGPLSDGEYFAGVEYDERYNAPNLMSGDWNSDGQVDLSLFGRHFGESQQLWFLSQRSQDELDSPTPSSSELIIGIDL